MGLSRREFLVGTTAGLTVCALPNWAMAKPSIQDNRFVFILLRGGLDGVSAVIPYAEPRYRALRGPLALPNPGGVDGPFKLSADFALHPTLKNCQRMFKEKELLVVPAIATPYRERSHFDGQNVMEGGGTAPYEYSTGWLNRCLTAISANADVHGMAVGAAVPLVMRGPMTVANWSPSFLPGPSDDTFDRLADMYQNDSVLSQGLQNYRETQAKLSEMDSLSSKKRSGHFVELARSAGKLLTGDDGAQIATLEAGGWDTHANQGSVSGRLATGLGFLDNGIEALKSALGSRWSQTTVVIMTEFGRTMKTNGTRGTDHGTASMAFVLGGNLRGGKILGDWPGLAAGDLYDGRDLRPTVDTRSLIRSVLAHQFDLTDSALNSQVFPNGGSLPEFEIPFRS